MKTFGVDPTNKTLTPCKAKPENRGKGSCFHGEHLELSPEVSTPEAIREYNEAALASVYGLFSPKSTRSQFSGGTVPSPGGGESLTREEFQAAASDLSDAFPMEDWDYINSFYHKFANRIGDTQLNQCFTSASDNIYSFLTGSDESAIKLRAYLGPEIDLKDFSEILVREVRSMRQTIPLKNGSGRQPIARVIMTSLDNDMTKKRYVASILYFGGRCCYCNCAMKKQVGPDQATGEHITPISPEDPNEPLGSTRFGNMALACLQCNSERRNQNLDDWLAKTQLLSDDQKITAKKRIEKFRQFALYSEYSTEESHRIRSEIVRLRELMKSFPHENKRMSSADFDRYRNQVDKTMAGLREMLRA